MLISVCMPCFNAAPYLAAALDSVLAQDFPRVEIVVADDGSTDASRDVLARYAGRVRALHGANRGASAARNAALAAASGDAVLFMDCDDLIGPGHLSALAGRLGGVGGGVVVPMGQWDRFHADPSEARFPPRENYRDADGATWLAAGGWDMMQSAMFLLPRALIERHGGWNETRSPKDDFEFYTRMIARSDGVRFVPGARVYYRSGMPGSFSRQRGRREVEGTLHSLIAGTGHLLAVEDTERTRRAAARVLGAFDHEHYPAHPELRAFARARVAELGGTTIVPSGPPRFHALRRVVGWRLARRLQRAVAR